MSRFILAATITGLIGWAVIISGVALLAKAFAGESWVTVPLASKHSRKGDHNEVNLGIGVEHELNERWRFAGGYYRNSNREDSLYAAAVHVYAKRGSWRFGSLYGVVTGYESDVTPMAGLVASYEQRDWGFNVILFPKDGAIVGFQIKFKW